jgi:hypothetical protein
MSNKRIEFKVPCVTCNSPIPISTRGRLLAFRCKECGRIGVMAIGNLPSTKERYGMLCRKYAIGFRLCGIQTCVCGTATQPDAAITWFAPYEPCQECAYWARTCAGGWSGMCHVENPDAGFVALAFHTCPKFKAINWPKEGERR